MTIREFFEAKRDPHGRAWIDERCWIELGSGRFQLNTPWRTYPFFADDEVGAALDTAGHAGATIGSEHDASDEDKDDVDYSESSGEASDERGAWPGLDGDDAEPDEFEDSVGDLLDDPGDDADES